MCITHLYKNDKTQNVNSSMENLVFSRQTESFFCVILFQDIIMFYDKNSCEFTAKQPYIIES